MDLSLFSNVPGLLTPEQQGNASSQGLESMAAALLKAAAPSPYKNTTLSGLGEGIQAGITGYNQGTDQALKQQLVRGQINSQSLAVLQTVASYHGAGLPIPPALQRMADAVMGGIAPQMAGGQPMQGAAQGGPMIAPPAAGPTPPAPPVPGLASAPSAPSAASPSAAIANRFPGPTGYPPDPTTDFVKNATGYETYENGQKIGGGTMQPLQQPAIGRSIVDSLPLQDRWNVVAKNEAGKAALEVAAKNMERTNEQKNAATPGPIVDLARGTKQAETDVAQYTRLHQGLAGAGMVASNSLPYIQAAKGLINDKGFYSGTAEGAVLGYKRALAGLGIDPGASLPQEAFRKTMAANILQQVNALKAEAETMGQQGGRIFASQIDLMEKAAQNPDNSVAANRYLTEVAARSADRTRQIADMADDYKTQHGALDAGFEKGIRKWIGDNPMFTPAELKNPSLVGAEAKPATSAAPAKTVVNRKTGERMGLVDGAWVPLK